jgi:2'-5' RNA ligase
MEAPVRSFLAIDPDEGATAALRGWLDALREAPWAGHVRWVAPGNLHITLRFLGDVAPARLAELGDALRGALRGAPAPFEVSLAAPAPFPNAARPRAIASLAAPHPALTQVAAIAERCAQGLGLAPEGRPFKGHLTFGRPRPELPRLAAPLLPVEPLALRVTGVTLYKSELTRAGAIYTALGRFVIGEGQGG